MTSRTWWQDEWRWWCYALRLEFRARTAMTRNMFSQTLLTRISIAIAIVIVITILIHNHQRPPIVTAARDHGPHEP